MPLRPSLKIVVLVEASRAYGRELLRGITRYARTQPRWWLFHNEMALDSPVPAWLAGLRVSGVIARASASNIDSLRAMGVPLIDVRCEQDFADLPKVETDNRLVAELAFDHLWRRGFRRFAFCGYQHAYYSKTRRDFFADCVKQVDCPISIYETSSGPDEALTEIESLGMFDSELLSEWLSSLTAPTGVFACNDIRGQQVLNACQALGIAVPDDLAVIGVDNDEVICELCSPPLSSVMPHAEGVGHRAAELLDQMIHGAEVSNSIERIPPTSVIERVSTQVKAIENRELARVCRFIRQHACDGIDVQDVDEFSTLSRRQLERLFRSHWGHTPHEEITATQIRRVKQLLCETTLSLEQIAPLAGYTHRERLSAVFKRETGGTPGQYRQTRAT